MHAALALWFERLRDGADEATIEEMLAVAHANLEEAAEGEVPIVCDGETDLRAECARLLAAFLENPLRPHRVLAVEQPFSIDVPSHPATGEVYAFEEAISGVWDLVVEDADGGISVIDHKVGKRAPLVEQGFDLQLLVYALAAEKVFAAKQPVRLFHHVLLRNKTAKVELREVPRVLRDVDEAVESVTSGLTMIHAAVAHPQPVRLLGRRRSWRCDGCAHHRRCAEAST